MEKLLALLAKGQYSEIEDEGDEQVAITYTIPNSEGGVDSFVVIMTLDSIKALGLVVDQADLAEIYAEYERDENGEPLVEDEEDEDDENA